MGARPLEFEDVNGLSPEEWLAQLKAHGSEGAGTSLIYPGFPDEEVQKQFVGSAFDDALDEGYNFYTHVASLMGEPSYQASLARRYLDFGCGWGRIGRFFLRDFQRGEMSGVDIDASMVDFCARSQVPGAFFQIFNGRPLPFGANSFRLITAYSVFTHLPPHLFRAWMDELLRVLAPGGLLVFTVEPPRFLDFIESVDPEKSENTWHAGLADHKKDMPALRATLELDGIAHLPTGGGDCRTPDVYGETVVTHQYVAQTVRPHGKVASAVDDPGRFWQAGYGVRKT